MSKPSATVTFKGTPMTLVGPKVEVGDHAPDFKCASAATTTVTLSETPAKPRIFSVVPSLDTPVCSLQTKTFDKGLSELGDKVASYTVSLDSPFAQKRFCSDNGVAGTVTLSDTHNHSFGNNYGVLLNGLAVPLLARAVFVVDASGVVRHAEYVAEVTHEPNYDAAMAALKSCL